MKPLTEIDYRALRYLMAKCEGSELKKQKELRKFDKAWREGRLKEPEKQDGRASWVTCETRFLLGEYGNYRGWEFRDDFSAGSFFVNPFPIPVWNPSKPCETLYIVGEQGIGDEVLFSQCVLDVKKLVKRVIFECMPRLMTVFERSLGVECVPADIKNNVRHAKMDIKADSWVALGELPRLFRKKEEDFPRKPYLTVDPNRIEEMTPYKGKVGFSWRGAQGTLPVNRMLPRLGHVVSLQYDQAWDEDVETPHIDLRNDVEGILALLSVLDHVVAPSTSVSHFASALGVPIDVVLADPKSGVKQNMIPWKWINKKCLGKTWWYSDQTRVYESYQSWSRDYRSRSFPQRKEMGQAA